MKFPDELCSYCNRRFFIHQGERLNCLGDCLLLDIVGKNIPLRERLLPNLHDNSDRNYNTVLSEYAEDREVRIDKLPQIMDKRKRAIASMLLAGLSKTYIAELLSMSYKQIARISKYNNDISD